MDSQLINTRRGDIEFRSVGNGIPVVFIHGGHSNCYETLSHKGFDLSKFHLITPSRQGYGKTPLSANHTPKDTADLIVELLNYLSIDQAIVYGISAGGLTAIELAANYHDRVQKLILASAISKKWLYKDQKIYKTAQVIFNPKIESVVWSIVRMLSKILPRMIANSFYTQFSNYPSHKLSLKDTLELVSALKHYRSKTGFLNDIDQEISDETIKNVQCQTLVIHSNHDNSVPFEHAKHSKNTIQNSRLIELDNEWGHLFWIGQDSDESIKKVIEFIIEK
jgi:pimeloyl-ACP methyl ester carboxylesterase